MGTDIHGFFQRKGPLIWETVDSKWEQNRDYRLFAWLANVRNGFGFAGVYTHEPIQPISEPRGFPDGLTQKYCDSQCEYEWIGDHSFSWLTVDEILAATPPKTRHAGVVSLADYKQLKPGEKPKNYCGDITGPKIVTSHPKDICELTTHIRVEWEEDWAESLKYFIDEVKRLKELHGEVRLVFGFDS